MGTMSPAGHAFIRLHEGVRAKVYRDTANKPTIGVGHLLTPGDLGLRQDATADQIEAAAKLRWPNGLSTAEIDALLSVDLAEHERAVTIGVKVPLAQPQFDALVSFSFNVGTAAFSRSSLLRRLNAGEYAAVPGELAKWNKITDPKTHTLVADPGLTKRRLAEAALWSSAPAVPGGAR